MPFHSAGKWVQYPSGSLRLLQSHICHQKFPTLTLSATSKATLHRTLDPLPFTVFKTPPAPIKWITCRLSDPFPMDLLSRLDPKWDSLNGGLQDTNLQCATWTDIPLLAGKQYPIRYPMSLLCNIPAKAGRSNTTPFRSYTVFVCPWKPRRGILYRV